MLQYLTGKLLLQKPDSLESCMDYHLTGAEFNTCAGLQLNKSDSQTRFLCKYKHKLDLLFTADASWRIPASRITWWNSYSGQADSPPDLQPRWGQQHKQGWHCKTPVESARNWKCLYGLPSSPHCHTQSILFIYTQLYS